MEDSKSYNLFEEYQEAIHEQLKIDEINLRSRLLEFPSVRHYWIGRLMFHKREIKRLESKKREAVQKLRVHLQNESPVGLSAKGLQDAIANHEVMVKIDNEIVNHELLVDYLQRVEQNLRTASYDLKNLVETIKMETT